MKSLIIALVTFFILFSSPISAQESRTTLWRIQSVDTMKYSRDLARVQSVNKKFDAEIDKQILEIKNLGATHVAIATPYDAEFVPFMTRWVNSARTHGLKVWFRGNFSGWENWYGYPDISQTEHIQKTREFILSNPQLFLDGDIYSPCHECENGGPGDPRQTGKVKEYRDFLISEYQVAKDAFKKINKDVETNYFSMNLDVAKLIMDKATTKSLDSVIVLDHYVASFDQLAQDLKDISKKTGATIVLGEYGAPIPDIHGEMSAIEQSAWLKGALDKLVEIPELHGINYWVSHGGSTEIWDSYTGQKKPAAGIIAQYYYPNILSGSVKDPSNKPILNAKIKYLGRDFSVDPNGHYELPLMPGHDQLQYLAQGFKSQDFTATSSSTQDVVLEPVYKGLLFRLQQFFYLLTEKAHSIIKSI